MYRGLCALLEQRAAYPGSRRRAAALTTCATDLAALSCADVLGGPDLLPPSCNRNQVNSVTLRQGAWAQQSTLTLVNDVSNAGNIQLFGRTDNNASVWTLMQTYDLQLGPTHPALLAGGQRAQVAVVTPRTTLATSALRYRQLQARVRESDGPTTTIPHCKRASP